MIDGKTIEELATAFSDNVVNKASEQMGRIKIIEVGSYEFESKNSLHRITCGRKDGGLLFVACTCKGSLHRGVCYASYLGFKTHIEVVKAQKSGIPLCIECRYPVHEPELQKNKYCKRCEHLKPSYLPPKRNSRPEQVGKIRIK